MIQFDIIFGKDVVRMEAACFGWLANVNDLDYRRGKIQDDNQKHFAGAFTRGEISPTELVWDVKKSVTMEQGYDVWAIVKEIVGAWPWLDEVVRLCPITKTVRVKLGDTPCDKSILCIGIIRNYFTVPSFPRSYLKAKECGASPQEAYIFAAMLEHNEDWRNEWSLCTRELWEYDAVNTGTFGRQALKAMCSPDYSPWRQATWNEQVGYHREHTLRENFRGFNGANRGRKLLDTFSVENDDRIFPDQFNIHVRQDQEQAQGLVNIIKQAFQA